MGNLCIVRKTHTRQEADRHPEYRAWPDMLVAGPTEVALTYAEAIRIQPHAHVVSPGAQSWPIFRDLCRKTGVAGKRVPDAYLAALAIEHGCEFITAGKDFRRFPGLRWRHPLN